MHKTMDVGKAIEGLAVGITTSAQASGVAKLRVLHREITSSLPTGDRQEIRVLLAQLEPGDVTPFHSHRFPVTVYLLDGTFTLDLEGQEPVTVRAGEVFVEPSGTRMTGRNLDATKPAAMVLFYVCEPDTPFANSAQ